MVLAVLMLMALALLSYYVHVLQDQVLRGQQFRAEFNRSGTLVASALPAGRAMQLVASRR